MIVRPLEADDAPLLAQFTAFLNPRGWEEVVDEVIRVHLPGLLSAGAGMTVVGAFSESGELVGIVAWRGSDVDGVAFIRRRDDRRPGISGVACDAAERVARKAEVFGFVDDDRGEPFGLMAHAC